MLEIGSWVMTRRSSWMFLERILKERLKQSSLKIQSSCVGPSFIWRTRKRFSMIFRRTLQTSLSRCRSKLNDLEFSNCQRLEKRIQTFGLITLRSLWWKTLTISRLSSFYFLDERQTQSFMPHSRNTWIQVLEFHHRWFWIRLLKKERIFSQSWQRSFFKSEQNWTRDLGWWKTFHYLLNLSWYVDLTFKTRIRHSLVSYIQQIQKQQGIWLKLKSIEKTIQI